MRRRNAYPAAIGAAVLLGSLVAAVPAHAGGGDFTEEEGACSRNSTWLMKAKHDDGRIELEFEVQSNRAGQTWAVRITDNGVLVYSGNQVTNRFNRFSADRRPADRAGTDRFVGRATNARTGEVCRGHVALGAAGSSGSSG
jgi:hypothetical protein